MEKEVKDMTLEEKREAFNTLLEKGKAERSSRVINLDEDEE